MKWNYEKIGLDCICFYTDGRRNVLFMEYDFKLGGFKNCTLSLGKYYYYNNRQYNRFKGGYNLSRYYRLLSTINIETWENAYKLFEEEV